MAYDGRSDKGFRILILTTKWNLETLAEYPNWFAHGTFYVVPKPFYQSFSIQAVVEGECLPLVFTFLVRNQQITSDFHLDRLVHGMTPAKKRQTSNDVLYQNCEDLSQCNLVLSYIFEVAKCFGHDQKIWINLNNSINLNNLVIIITVPLIIF